MKTLCFLLSLAAFSPSLSQGAPEGIELKPGLEVREYPRHRSQSDRDKAELAVKEFGEPIGKNRVVKSVLPWTWNQERNAIASGVLVIEKEGDYEFTTNSFYDRNTLKIDGKVICGFADGTSTIVTIPLKKGNVGIESVGFVDSRGSAEVRWRPPGQRELSAIPLKNLKHWGARKSKKEKEKGKSGAEWAATSLTVVAKDFVLEVYRNGKRVPDSKRKLLLDRFGATAERIDLSVREGDWLVFQVAHNRLRHGGTKYFGLAGALGENPFAIVSAPGSADWSSCDDPEQVKEFIRNRDYGTGTRALAIEKPWEEGLKFMNQYAGEGFSGEPIWGEGPSTWLKLVVAKSPGKPVIESPRLIDLENVLGREPKLQPTDPAEALPEIEIELVPEALPVSSPKRWPVQILSAIYGTGGKNADVTEKVKQLVEEERKFFAANPGHLGADPNPYWNKGLHIVYMKDGIRREQRRNENEHILPESFYGPHDAAELTEWLTGTRWKGPNGDVQFHANGVLAGTHLKRAADWEAIGRNRLRLTWSAEEKKEFVFDYVWSSFADPKDGKNTYQLVK